MDPLPKDANMGPTVLGVATTMVFIGVFLWILRMWARMPKTGMTLGWDDFFITLAIIVSLIQWGLTVAIVAHGYGRHIVYLSKEQVMQINKYQFISFIPWGWVNALPKISVCCLLLRLKKNTRNWKIFLFGMIMLQTCSAIFCTVIVIKIAEPYAATWNPDAYPNAKRLNPKITQNGLYFLAAVNIFTDLLLSLLPITFISRMHQPLRTRLLISVLMALGLSTTAIASWRTYLVWEFSQRTITDPTWDNATVTIVAILEGALAIIAVTVPTLKRPFELALTKLGFASTTRQDSDSNPPMYQDPVLKSWHDPEDNLTTSLNSGTGASSTRSQSEKSCLEHRTGVA